VETRQQAPWVLYILRAADARLYTGITTDVARRFVEHSQGGRLAAKALRGRAPLQLVFTSAFEDRSQASVAEYRVKRLSRAAKERLVAGDITMQSVLAGDV
jgi:putative endonuclease